MAIWSCLGRDPEKAASAPVHNAVPVCVRDQDVGDPVPDVAEAVADSAGPEDAVDVLVRGAGEAG